MPGTPEIEIQVNGAAAFDQLALVGGSGADHFRFGAAGINLNADEAVGQDVDVTTSNVGFLRASTSGGNDMASGEGGRGTGAATSGPLLFRGGTEDDQLTGGEGVDFLAGDDGNDTIRGGNGDDRGLDGGTGNDTIDGEGGAGDVARYADAASGVTVDLGQTGAQNTGGDGFDTLANLEHIEGSGHADVLSGNDGTNTIRAGLGADTLDGRGGNDTLDGGDATSGLPSPDTAIYVSAASGVTADLDAAEATGGGGTDSLVDIQNVTGSDFEDVLTGNAEENLLRGGEGPDTVTGGAGGDDVRGEGGSDELMLRDGTRDVADCGSEPDNVTADAFGVDAIDANCETIDYLGGIPTPSPGGGDAGIPAPSGGDDAGGGAGTGVPSNAFAIVASRSHEGRAAPP